MAILEEVTPTGYESDDTLKDQEPKPEPKPIITETPVEPESEPEPKPKPEPKPNKNELKAQPGSKGMPSETPELEPIDLKQELIDARDYMIGARESFDQFSAGTLDTAAGALKWNKNTRPIGDWWLENSKQPKNDVDAALRKAGGVIIPVVTAGSAIPGMIAKSTAGVTIPAVTRIAGTIAANMGIDTLVTAASTSADDESFGSYLEKAFGFDFGNWVEHPEDSPQWRRAKNLLWNMGLSVGVDLLGLTTRMLRLNRQVKPDLIIPRTEQAANIVEARNIKRQTLEDILVGDVDPVVKDIELNQKLGELEKVNEGAERLIKGVDSYDPYVNTDVTKPLPVQNVGDDVIDSVIDQVKIQKNINTTNGRPRPVISTKGMKDFYNAADGTIRGELLDEVAAQLPKQIDVVSNGKRLTGKTLMEAVDTLTENITTMKPSELANDLNKAKTKIIQDAKFLDDDSFIAYSNAFKRVFDNLLSPDRIRASSLITQQAADNAVSGSTASILLKGLEDTSEIQKSVHKNLELVIRELRANRWIAGRQLKLMDLMNGDPAVVAARLAEWEEGFEAGLKEAKDQGSLVFRTLDEIAEVDPDFLMPFKMAYDATNGDVDTLYKLHRWIDNSLGVWNKAIVDNEPKIPSLVLQGLNSVRFNNLLSGKAGIRALMGNATQLVAKPINTLVGSVATQDMKTFKRALYSYGGIMENLQRGFKVAGEDWRNAVANPQLAAMRGREDLSKTALQNVEILEATKEAFRKKGDIGKVALINMVQVTSWYNNNAIARWGINSMHAIDGFTGSFTASAMARAEAYDRIFSKLPEGAFLDSKETVARFNELQNKLYSKAFDESGLLTNEAAKNAAGEIALNLDDEIVTRLQRVMDKIPVLKAAIMFPKTGVNGLKLLDSYVPRARGGSSLGPALTKARRLLSAKTTVEITEALAEHGMEYSDEAFKQLKSEYIGRQLMGSAVVMAGATMFLAGNVTGNYTQDPAENQRLRAMGAKFKQIRNPLTGEWHSYEGFQPYDSLLGLISDTLFHATRVDEAITEDMLRKIGMSISMNVTNMSFLSAFEPILSLASGDPSAWSRFLALQADSIIPATGARQILNRIIQPQLVDATNHFWDQLKRRAAPWTMPEVIDIYTGEPIYPGQDNPISDAIVAMLPAFKTTGKMEPWRQWLLATGWNQLQIMRTNPDTGEPLTADQRQKINTWIGDNMRLDKEIEKMMNRPDKFWDRKVKEYVKLRKLRSQSLAPIKELVVHEALTQLHRSAFDQAWGALTREDKNFAMIRGLRQRRDRALNRGDMEQAGKDIDALEQLLQMNR